MSDYGSEASSARSERTVMTELSDVVSRASRPMSVASSDNDSIIKLTMVVSPAPRPPSEQSSTYSADSGVSKDHLSTSEREESQYEEQSDRASESDSESRAWDESFQDWKSKVSLKSNLDTSYQGSQGEWQEMDEISSIGSTESLSSPQYQDGDGRSRYTDLLQTPYSSDEDTEVGEEMDGRTTPSMGQLRSEQSTLSRTSRERGMDAGDEHYGAAGGRQT